MTRVLVADDEPSIRGLITEALAMDGHEVEAVATESEAVLVYDSVSPGVLILDVNMNHGGAQEILRRLDEREGGVRCPVIVVTGDGSYDEGHPQLCAVLSKPFDIAALRQAVSSALARP